MIKNTKPINPFKNLILDDYEQEIEDAINLQTPMKKSSKKERLFWTKLANQQKELKKSKRINIRINNLDIAKVKAKAKANNMPYQTLLSSLIHKYAEDELKIIL